MHRALLRMGILLILLAVMTAAGGCVALYTASRAVERPEDAGSGVGVPLFPPGAAAPSATKTAAFTTQRPGGDGLPFNPSVTDTPPPPIPRRTDAPVETARRSSNATPVRIPMPTETPPVAGPPPHDEIPRPTLPATPL
jgi:hypothetical protein